MNSFTSFKVVPMIVVAMLAAAAPAHAQDDLQLDLPSAGQEQPGQSDQTPQEKRLENPVAEFAGLDKITGRIISFDVYIDETVQFGALQVTPKVCYSSPETAEPKTDAFIEVDEITLDRKIQRIFTGWMFAESPGLNAVEHPVYDVWLKACKQTSDVPPPDQQDSSSTAPSASNQETNGDGASGK